MIFLINIQLLMLVRLKGMYIAGQNENLSQMPRLKFS